MTMVQKRLVGLAVLLVLGALGAYVAVWQTRASDEAASAEARQKKVLALSDPKEIREVELTTPDGTFVVAREGQADGSTEWWLTTPRRVPADGTVIDGLLASLTSLQRTGEIAEPGAKLGLFGLAEPRFIVTLKDAKGAVETLLAGKKNSFDGSLYVKKPDAKAILLVGGGLEYQLDKDLFALRDKRLLELSEGEVERIAVTLDGKPGYVLEKQESIYRLTAPLSAAADSVQVTGIVSALGGQTAKQFVTEETGADELRRFGLHRPTVRVDLGLTGGGKQAILFAEKGGDVTRSYATVLDAAGRAGPILELGRDWALSKLKVSPSSLRDMHVAVFDRQDVGGVVIKKGDVELRFARTEDPAGGESWDLVSPHKSKAQASRLAGLVYRLWNLKAERIVSEKATPTELKKHGVDAPVITVELSKKDGSPLARFAFGAVEGEEQYVAASGSPRLDVVEKGFADEISTNAADYEEAPTASK